MNKPIIFIVGPTGSGKTEVSLRLAQRFNGEIICADSRTVYQGLDIGTAKPSPVERARIPHWGLDLVTPQAVFSAHQFKVMAQAAIRDIQKRDKLPIVVGGTGLYVDTLLYNMELGPKADKAVRDKLESLTIDELQVLLREKQLSLPANEKNKRHLIRAIELKGKKPSRSQAISNAIVVGISASKDILIERLRQRATIMFNNPALFTEAEDAASHWGWGASGMSGNIYRLVHQLQEGMHTKEEAIARSATLDWQLAKRQLTWFRRNPDIVWLEREQVTDYIAQKLR